MTIGGTSSPDVRPGSLGWDLGMVAGGYQSRMEAALGGFAGGLRGFLVLSTVAYAWEQKRPLLTRRHVAAVATGLAATNAALLGALYVRRETTPATCAGVTASSIMPEPLPRVPSSPRASSSPSSFSSCGMIP